MLIFNPEVCCSSCSRNISRACGRPLSPRSKLLSSRLRTVRRWPILPLAVPRSAECRRMHIFKLAKEEILCNIGMLLFSSVLLARRKQFCNGYSDCVLSRHEGFLKSLKQISKSGIPLRKRATSYFSSGNLTPWKDLRGLPRRSCMELNTGLSSWPVACLEEGEIIDAAYVLRRPEFRRLLGWPRPHLNSR